MTHVKPVTTPLHDPPVVQVAEGIGKGLAALHNKGIVHRDLKPQNVLLTATQQAKLSDMGFSKRLAAGQSSFESTGGGAFIFPFPPSIMFDF